MPEGTQAGGTQHVPKRLIMYVGVSDSQEIAATGQVAEHGVPLEVVDKPRVVRHILDDHGRYQDVKYPGVAEQLLQRADFIVPSSDKPKKTEVEAAAQAVRALSYADTHGERQALELAARGEHVDEIAHGEPGYQIVPAGTFTQGAGEPQEPTVVPEQGQRDVQPNPPVNLQPPSPQAQTGIAPDAEVKEGDPERDRQQQPGRARTRSSGNRATRRS